MFLRRFVLAALWMTLVLTLGFSFFGKQRTEVIVLPVLKAFVPGASSAQLRAAHEVVRKIVHLSEYAVLALLWFQTLVARRTWTPRRASWAAISICLLCAFADEAHQSMLLARTGSARDLVLDGSGALAMLIVARSRREMSDTVVVSGGQAIEPAD
jgi:VanZ family protein